MKRQPKDRLASRSLVGGFVVSVGSIVLLCLSLLIFLRSQDESPEEAQRSQSPRVSPAPMPTPVDSSAGNTYDQNSKGLYDKYLEGNGDSAEGFLSVYLLTSDGSLLDELLKKFPKSRQAAIARIRGADFTQSSGREEVLGAAILLAEVDESQALGPLLASGVARHVPEFADRSIDLAIEAIGRPNLRPLREEELLEIRKALVSTGMEPAKARLLASEKEREFGAHIAHSLKGGIAAFSGAVNEQLEQGNINEAVDLVSAAMVPIRSYAEVRNSYFDNEVFALHVESSLLAKLPGDIPYGEGEETAGDVRARIDGERIKIVRKYRPLMERSGTLPGRAKATFHDIWETSGHIAALDWLAENSQ